MNTHRLIAAPTQWQIPNVVDRVTSDFRGRVDDLSAAIRWRPDVLTDFRNKRVPTAAVRLIRWDQHSPEVIFRVGFTPLSDGRVGGCDLRSFVLSGDESIFVSATNCSRDMIGGRVTRWKPDNCANLYEYEIFAYGGIDVDRSMVKLHPSVRKGDVVFPMGIRREFVRSALEYDKSGVPIRFWINGYFDVDANGASFTPTLDDYPRYIYSADVPVVPWTETNNTYNRIKAPDGARIIGDVMSKLQGQLRAIQVESLLDQTVARTAMLLPKANGEAIFFADTRAITINIMDDVCTSPSGTAVVIDKTWSSLAQLGIATIDAIVPHHVQEDSGYVYVFSGTQFACVNIVDDVKDYVCTFQITSKWESLARAGFNTIDGAIKAPNSMHIYFFKGTQYVRVDCRYDTIVEGPRNISSRWPVLGEIGFTTIDAIMPTPNDPSSLLIFSGSEYVVIPVHGEGPVAGPNQISDKWRVLVNNRFY